MFHFDICGYVCLHAHKFMLLQVSCVKIFFLSYLNVFHELPKVGQIHTEFTALHVFVYMRDHPCVFQVVSLFHEC